MTEQLFSQLASTGVVGVFLVLTLLALKAERKRSDEIQASLDAEKDARIADAAAGTDKALSIQKQVNDNIGKLGEVLELIERREIELADARRAAEGGGGGPFRKPGGTGR